MSRSLLRRDPTSNGPIECWNCGIDIVDLICPDCGVSRYEPLDLRTPIDRIANEDDYEVITEVIVTVPIYDNNGLVTHYRNVEPNDNQIYETQFPVRYVRRLRGQVQALGTEVWQTVDNPSLNNGTWVYSAPIYNANEFRPGTTYDIDPFIISSSEFIALQTDLIQASNRAMREQVGIAAPREMTYDEARQYLLLMAQTTNDPPETTT